MTRAVQTGRRRCGLLLVAAALLCGLGALGAAPSMGAPATLQFSTGEFTVNCTSTGQLCEPPFQQTVQVPSGGRVTSVMYTAPPGHCSPAKIHVLLDGTEIGATGFLEPNESSELAVFSDPIRKGSVVLGYQAEGKVGGCNVGQVGSWGGSVVTTVTLPETKIKGGPPKKTHRRKATFTFASNEAGSKFECKLDKRKFKGCASPKKYNGLSPGKHTFKVRSIDSVGNRDSTPASFSWRILP
jgi:hypothetical protein